MNREISQTSRIFTLFEPYHCTSILDIGMLIISMSFLFYEIDILIIKSILFNLRRIIFLRCLFNKNKLAFALNNNNMNRIKLLNQNV